MTTKQLSPVALPSAAIAEGATTPNPGAAGSWAWSTTLQKPVFWDGALWTAGTAGLSQAQVLAVVSMRI